MDSIDKKVQDELSVFDNEIPAGMRWDEMNNGIMEKMPRKKRKLVPLIILIGTASLFLLVIVISFVRNNHTDVEKSSTVEYSITTDEKKDWINKSPTNAVTDDTSYEQENDNEKTENTKKLEANSKKTTVKIKNTKNKDNLTIERVVDSPIRESATFSATTVSGNLSAYNSENSSELRSTFSVSSFLHGDFQGRKIVEGLSLLELMDIEKLELTERTINLSPMRLIAMKPAEMQVKSVPRLSISSGTKLWNWGVKKGQKFQVSSSEETLISAALQVTIHIPLVRKLYLQSGLQYADFRTRFNHEFRKTSQSVDNSLASPVYNVLTRKTTNLSPALVTVTETRKVLSYNHYRLLQVPLLLETFIDKGRWEIGVSGGINTSLLLDSRGKSFNSKNEFVDLQQDSPLKRFLGFGIQGDLKLAYKLQENNAIVLSTSFSNSLSNWTMYADDIRKPRSLFIGLGYKINI